VLALDVASLAHGNLLSELRVMLPDPSGSSSVCVSTGHRTDFVAQDMAQATQRSILSASPGPCAPSAFGHRERSFASPDDPEHALLFRLLPILDRTQRVDAQSLVGLAELVHPRAAWEGLQLASLRPPGRTGLDGYDMEGNERIAKEHIPQESMSSESKVRSVLCVVSCFAAKISPCLLFFARWPVWVSSCFSFRGDTVSHELNYLVRRHSEMEQRVDMLPSAMDRAPHKLPPSRIHLIRS